MDNYLQPLKFLISNRRLRRTRWQIGMALFAVGTVLFTGQSDAEETLGELSAMISDPGLTPQDQIPPERRVEAFIQGAHRTMDIDEARMRGLTIVDLSDDWVPYIFWSETPGTDDFKMNAYQRNYVDLANDRIDVDGNELEPDQHNYLEVFGIPPSLSVIKDRLASDQAKECFQELNLELFADYRGPVKASDLGSSARVAKRLEEAHEAYTEALTAAGVTTLEELAELEPYQNVAERYRTWNWRMQAMQELPHRLVCEGLLAADRANPGVIDWYTQNALKMFERKNHVYGWGMIYEATAAALARTPEENHVETLKRVLTERVVSAVGVLEDGSSDARFTKTNGVNRELRNLIEEYRHSFLLNLGITDTASGLAFLNRFSKPDLQRLWVAVPLPGVPEYYSDNMNMVAVIDRGDVWYDLPFDEDGKRIPQPRRRKPHFQLVLRYHGQEIPLVRWPTTIGGWNSELLNGEEYYKYKISDVGPRLWRHIIAGPVWVPPAKTPSKDVVKKRARHGRIERVLNSSVIGPGYASAYGLVAAFHINETGYDNLIRTHGTFNYMSVFSGYSHGCHRLFNYRAVRLFSFILRHRPFRRIGQTTIDYSWRFEHRGEEFEVNLDTRGYYYALTPPLEVDVLEGTIRGERTEPHPDYVKRPGRVYQDDLPQPKGKDRKTGNTPKVRKYRKSILSDEQLL